MENLNGSPFDDILTGNAAGNVLFGAAGADRLDGLGGDDHLVGDEASGVAPYDPDVMIGGSGTDEVNYANRTATVIVDLNDSVPNDGEVGEGDSVGSDVENVVGGLGDDILVGNASANRMNGLDGNDGLFGMGGDDMLIGVPETTASTVAPVRTPSMAFSEPIYATSAQADLPGSTANASGRRSRALATNPAPRPAGIGGRR